MSEQDTADIRKEFLAGELGYIDAVMALEGIGMDERDAEALVAQWETGQGRGA